MPCSKRPTNEHPRGLGSREAVPVTNQPPAALLTAEVPGLTNGTFSRQSGHSDGSQVAMDIVVNASSG